MLGEVIFPNSLGHAAHTCRGEGGYERSNMAGWAAAKDGTERFVWKHKAAARWRQWQLPMRGKVLVLTRQGALLHIMMSRAFQKSFLSNNIAISVSSIFFACHLHFFSRCPSLLLLRAGRNRVIIVIYFFPLS